MKKSFTKTTPENFEARFDAGEDISDYFDFTRAVMMPPLTRTVAGKRKLIRKRKTVTLSTDTIFRLERYALKNRLPNFSAAIEAAVAKIS
jgi:hypothetical protein